MSEPFGRSAVYTPSTDSSPQKSIKKSFKFRLYPNKEQAAKLNWVLERCCELYNAALQERKEAWKYARKYITYYDQQNDLPDLKYNIRPEYQEISAHVLQDVLRRLDRAFQNFFRRIKVGEEPGYPRFRGKNRYNSFTYPDETGWKLREKNLVLPKIGSLKVKLHREIQGKIKTTAIKREIDKWYVVFSCEVEAPEKLPISYEDVGIDLGLTHLATLSNGEMIEHPRHLRKAEKKLAKLQQSLSRKKRGSNRHKRVVKQLSKTYLKVRTQRRDFLHKESRKLVNRFQVIVFEDLEAANLTRRPRPKQGENGQYLHNGASQKSGLNKSIMDAGWGTLIFLCTHKAESAGRTVIKVDPKLTSQICSGCGQIKQKDLSERWHSCDCGAELDRDVNAAINILERGRRSQGLAL